MEVKSNKAKVLEKTLESMGYRPLAEYPVYYKKSIDLEFSILPYTRMECSESVKCLKLSPSFEADVYRIVLHDKVMPIYVREYRSFTEMIVNLIKLEEELKNDGQQGEGFE